MGAAITEHILEKTADEGLQNRGVYKIQLRYLQDSCTVDRIAGGGTACVGFDPVVGSCFEWSSSEFDSRVVLTSCCGGFTGNSDSCGWGLDEFLL